MRAHKFRRWLLRWLGVDAIVEAKVAAKLWQPPQKQPAIHSVVYVESEPNPLQESNEAYAARNRMYVPQIHTQHGLPAIRARRVIPARIWLEKRKQGGQA